MFGKNKSKKAATTKNCSNKSNNNMEASYDMTNKANTAKKTTNNKCSTKNGKNC